EIIFSTFASVKRKQNRIRLKNMRNTSPAAPTIRFRRWSRKAYAAFASIGRCVTIGCLRKNVADSSLSKQKAAGTAGHAGCEEESAWKGETEGRETDTGIPLGSSSALTSILRSWERTGTFFLKHKSSAPAGIRADKTHIA